MRIAEEVVAARLRNVRARIQAACERAGRRADEVLLVVVTKTVLPDVVQLLDATDVTDIGESRVQDALSKAAVLEEHWPGFSKPGSRRFRVHMIGHLQTNKVRKALPLFDLVHSLDSHKLAQAMSEEARRLGLTARVLVQVNVSGEAAKHGIAPAELGAFLKEVRQLPAVSIEGLMTMAPEDPDPEKARLCFRELRRLLDRELAAGALPPEARHLSMGMTQDFEVAVEEGATIVRIGSAIWGSPAAPVESRPPKQLVT